MKFKHIQNYANQSKSKQIVTHKQIEDTCETVLTSHLLEFELFYTFSSVGVGSAVGPILVDGPATATFELTLLRGTVPADSLRILLQLEIIVHV